MQHASSADYPLVGGAFLELHSQSEVLLQLLVESVADVAAGAEFPFFAEEGRVVDGEKHRHGRFVDGDGRHGFRSLEVADGVADFEVAESDDGANVS